MSERDERIQTTSQHQIEQHMPLALRTAYRFLEICHGMSWVWFGYGNLSGRHRMVVVQFVNN